VISNNVSGSSSFSATGKLVIQLPYGPKKQYFMKVPLQQLLPQSGRGEESATMFKGEYVCNLKDH
jgi:hypothetical protein